MKKLISLLAALAVVSTCTMSAFAFTVESTDAEGNTTSTAMTVTTVAEPATYEADEDGKYTVDASVAGTQDQTTILAVKGDVVRLGSIEYIDQSATQSFSFALRNELAAGETVNVLVGGSAGTVYHTGSMQGESQSQEPPTFTIEGYVTDENLAEIPFDELTSEGFSTEEIDYFKEAWGTKVYLIKDDAEHTDMVNYLLTYLGEEGLEPINPIATATADLVTGKYTFSNVEAGNYAMIFERAGAIPLLTYVDVTDSNVTVGNKQLLLGDLYADLACDSSDIIEILNANSSYGDDLYTASYDIYPDWALDSSDIILILTNSKLNYEEKAYDDVLAILEG